MEKKLKTASVQKGVKYRLLPTEDQKKDLNRLFAIQRRCWNFFHAGYNFDDKEEKQSEKLKRLRREYREYLKLEENEWQVLKNKRYQAYLEQDYVRAWKKFWDAAKSGLVAQARAKYRADFELKKKAGTKIKWNQKRFDGFYKPKFKSWFEKNSISIDDKKGDAVFDLKNKVFRPCASVDFIKVKIRKRDKIWSEEIAKYCKYTLSRDPSWRYWLTISFEAIHQDNDHRNSASIGMDWGVKDFATLSNNVKVNLRDTARIDYQIKKVQEKISRSWAQNNGIEKWEKKNFTKLKRKIARLHAKKASIRSNDTHKFTHCLTKCYTHIGVENLNVKGMSAKSKAKLKEDEKTFARNNKKQKAGLARSVLANNPYETKRQLKYKSSWRGGRTVEVDRFFPSSQICNSCGHHNRKLSLSDRDWVCTNCGEVHDRDENASINIEQESIKKAGVNTPSKNAFPSGEECNPSSSIGTSSITEENNTTAHRRQNQGEIAKEQFVKLLKTNQLHFKESRGLN